MNGNANRSPGTKHLFVSELSVIVLRVEVFCQQLNAIFAVCLHVGSSSFYCIFCSAHTVYD